MSKQIPMKYLNRIGEKTKTPQNLLVERDSLSSLQYVWVDSQQQHVGEPYCFDVRGFIHSAVHLVMWISHVYLRHILQNTIKFNINLNAADFIVDAVLFVNIVNLPTTL